MTTHESLIAAVRQIRRNGELPSERTLADQLKVKRHQLRKALNALRESGDLAPPRPRKTAALAPRGDLASFTNPLEVIELRLILEPGLARHACLRASAQEAIEIIRLATTPAGSKPETVDLQFHLAVARAARNHLAHELYALIRNIGVDARMRVARVTPATCPKRIAARDAEHRRVADAIANRDPEAAEAAMRAHLLAVQQRIVERSNAGQVAA